MPRNYYEIMGLDRPPTEKEIHMAYRRIRYKYNKHYLDSLGPYERRKALAYLKQVDNAYKVLSDPEARFKYDNPQILKKMPVKKKIEVMKRGVSASPTSKGGWLVTFSDMVTLLLTFFVFLWTFSTTDAMKFREIMGSIKEGFSVMKLPATKSAQQRFGAGPMLDILRSGGGKSDVFEGLKNYIQSSGLKDKVSLIKDERGTVLRVNNVILFKLGEASINPEAYSLLSQIAKVIIKSPVEVSVEGHTDNLPIRSKKFPSNWELSTARATSVVKFFIEKCNVPPYKLSAAGFGDQHPLFPNDTPEHRARNRRVEIVFKRMF